MCIGFCVVGFCALWHLSIQFCLVQFCVVGFYELQLFDMGFCAMCRICVSLCSIMGHDIIDNIEAIILTKFYKAGKWTRVSFLEPNLQPTST
jgi:hypothetical protein